MRGAGGAGQEQRMAQCPLKFDPALIGPEKTTQKDAGTKKAV